MADDLGKVLALELFTAAQALDVRMRMLAEAQALAADADAFAAKVRGGPDGDGPARAAFLAEVDELRVDLREAGALRPGRAVAAAHAAIRERIGFLVHDRALDGDVGEALRIVSGSVRAAIASGND
jgi:histidine ammonia-lyase